MLLPFPPESSKNICHNNGKMTFQLQSIPLLSLLTIWRSLPSLPAAAHGAHVLAPGAAHGGAETQDRKAEREAIYFLLSILFEPIRRKIEGLTVWEHDVGIMGSFRPTHMTYWSPNKMQNSFKSTTIFVAWIFQTLPLDPYPCPFDPFGFLWK